MAGTRGRGDCPAEIRVDGDVERCRWPGGHPGDHEVQVVYEATPHERRQGKDDQVVTIEWAHEREPDLRQVVTSDGRVAVTTDGRLVAVVDVGPR